MPGSRSPGRIRAAHLDTSHIATIWVQVVYDEGGSQGFGGIALTENAVLESYTGDLLRTFGVQHLDGLAGRRCWILRRRDRPAADIEGLEAEDGSQFTITDWQRKHGFPTRPLEDGDTDWSSANSGKALVWSLVRIQHGSFSDEVRRADVQQLFKGLVDREVDNLRISAWLGFDRLPKDYQRLVAAEWRIFCEACDQRRAMAERPLTAWERLMGDGRS
jgi:hypothetical protein